MTLRDAPVTCVLCVVLTVFSVAGTAGFVPPTLPLRLNRLTLRATWSEKSTVAELKAACRGLSLKVSGRKSELLERLEQAEPRPVSALDALLDAPSDGGGTSSEAISPNSRAAAQHTAGGRADGGGGSADARGAWRSSSRTAGRASGRAASDEQQCVLS